MALGHVSTSGHTLCSRVALGCRAEAAPLAGGTWAQPTSSRVQAARCSRPPHADVEARDLRAVGQRRPQQRAFEEGGCARVVQVALEAACTPREPGSPGAGQHVVSQ